jgi:hypothetical protein
MQRFAIVTHSSKDAELKLVGGKIIGQMPVHDLVGSYHWFRLDDDHIMVMMNYAVSNHALLNSHPKVSLLPHIGSSRTIAQHIQKNSNNMVHKDALQIAFNLDDTHTMEDLTEMIVAKQGAIYAPSI